MLWGPSVVGVSVVLCQRCCFVLVVGVVLVPQVVLSLMVLPEVGPVKVAGPVVVPSGSLVEFLVEFGWQQLRLLRLLYCKVLSCLWLS